MISKVWNIREDQQSTKEIQKPFEQISRHLDHTWILQFKWRKRDANDFFTEFSGLRFILFACLVVCGLFSPYFIHVRAGNTVWFYDAWCTSNWCPNTNVWYFVCKHWGWARSYFILVAHYFEYSNDWKANCEIEHQQHQQQHIPDLKLVIYTAESYKNRINLTEMTMVKTATTIFCFCQYWAMAVFDESAILSLSFFNVGCIPNLFKSMVYWCKFDDGDGDGGGIKRTIGNIAIAMWQVTMICTIRIQSFRMPLIKIQNMKMAK